MIVGFRGSEGGGELSGVGLRVGGVGVGGVVEGVRRGMGVVNGEV